MNVGEIAMFVAIGFVPTLIVLELAYRWTGSIGRRGELPSVKQHNSKIRRLLV
jgi:hypothetical protein